MRRISLKPLTTSLCVRTVGVPTFELDGAVVASGESLFTAVLFYLSWQAPRPVLRSSLGTLFWPGQSSARWRHCLNQQLSRIRKVLPSCVTSVEDFVSIATLSVSIDAKDVIVADGFGVDSESLVRLALDFPGLWQGRFGRSFDDWLVGLSAKLRDTVMRVLWSSERDAIRKGDWTSVRSACNHILAIDDSEPVAHHDRALAVAVDSSLRAALTLLRQAPRSARRQFRKSFDPIALATLDRTGFQLRNRSQEIGAAQFVGREAEYQELIAAWSSVKEGSFRLVVVRGEAGIGKTRLAERILRFAALQGGRILPGCAIEAEQLLPYAALRECISDIRPAERDAIAPWAREELVRSLDRQTSELSLDEQHEPTRVTEALRDLLHRLSERSPVVLFIDDAHWADSATLALLSTLQRSHSGFSSNRPMLLPSLSRFPVVTRPVCGPTCCVPRCRPRSFSGNRG